MKNESSTSNNKTKDILESSISSTIIESQKLSLSDMGYDKELINNVYLFLKPNTLSEAIELMNKTEDGIYQHEFFECIDNYDNQNKGKCLICGEIRKNHIGNEDYDEEIKDYNNNKKAKNPKSQVQYCVMCYSNSLSENEINENKLECGHLGCNLCWYKYIKERINKDKLAKITCLWPSCIHIVSEAFIRKKIAGKKNLIKKYEEALYKAEIISNTHKKLCPYPDCSGFLLKKDNDDKYVSCNKNKRHKYCFVCLNAWHGSTTCDEEINKDIQNWEKKTTIKSCPHCKFRTEKIGGCNRLLCPGCKHEWCWLCGGKYERGHYNKGLCAGKAYLKKNFIEKVSKIPKKELPQNKDNDAFLEQLLISLQNGNWLGNKGWCRFFKLLFITFTSIAYYQAIIYVNFTERCVQRYGRGIENVIALLTFFCFNICYQIPFVFLTLLSSLLTTYHTKYNLLYNIYLISFEDPNIPLNDKKEKES